MKKVIMSFLLLCVALSFVPCQNQPESPKSRESDVKNYRGLRVAPSSNECIVENVSYGKKDGRFYLEVSFNVPVAPASVSEHSVFLEEGKLKFKQVVFNREGTLCRIYAEEISLSGKIIFIKNVKSFDGKTILEFSKKM